MNRVLASLVAAVLGATAPGQTGQRPGGDMLGPDARVLHRLDFASSYRTEPITCDHLPRESELVRGTMRFVPGPTTDANVTRAFAVREVNWLLTPPDFGRVTDDVLITGGGVYRLTRSIDTLPVLGHRMTLHLRVGDEPVRFDSGLVNGSPWTGGNTLPFFHILVEDTDPQWPLMRVDVVAGPIPGP